MKNKRSTFIIIHINTLYHSELKKLPIWFLVCFHKKNQEQITIFLINQNIFCDLQIIKYVGKRKNIMKMERENMLFLCEMGNFIYSRNVTYIKIPYF